MGFVYLLLEVDDLGCEKHKIGISKNAVESRVSQLQTGNPNEISCLRQYESPYYKQIERWLHSKYNLNKTLAKNEWFNLTDEQVLSFIADCKKIEEMIKLLGSGFEF